MTGDIHAYLHLRMLTKHFIGHIIKIFKTNIKWTNKKFIKIKYDTCCTNLENLKKKTRD